MKKIILAATLFLAFTSMSFANEKRVDRKLLSDLQTALKNSKDAQVVNKSEYTQLTFNFNGKPASAFYNAVDNELVGFGIQLAGTNIPGMISDAVKNKYGDWTIADAMIFISTNGNLNYFVQVQKDKKNLALKVTPNGSVGIYANMNSWR